jgi:DNA-binding response OmpR family regulator
MSKIVIYEEDPLMRALLQEWLCSAGYHVPDTPRGRELPSGADLVIASICSPKHAGAYVLQEIRASHPETPLIALSGQFRGGLSSAGTTAQSLGVAQIIAKPLTRGTLLGAVHATIGPPN